MVKNAPMESYHILDGARVKVIYPGNTRTCARCHCAPSQHPGDGLVKQCEAKGTDSIPLTTHLKLLWSKLDTITKNSVPGDVIRELEGDNIGVPVGGGGEELNRIGEVKDQVVIGDAIASDQQQSVTADRKTALPADLPAAVSTPSVSDAAMLNANLDTSTPIQSGTVMDAKNPATASTGQQAATVLPSQTMKSLSDDHVDAHNPLEDSNHADQSSFEQSCFKSQGGTLPDIPPVEDRENKRESLIIFKE